MCEYYWIVCNNLKQNPTRFIFVCTFVYAIVFPSLVGGADDDDECLNVCGFTNEYRIKRSGKNLLKEKQIVAAYQLSLRL